jgi:carbamoyl-phosphate synthase small subunit
VDGDSLPEGSGVTFINANDKTVEGFENEHLNISCVQFHPEAHAGPLDTECHYFDGLFRRLK